MSVRAVAVVCLSLATLSLVPVGALAAAPGNAAAAAAKADALTPQGAAAVARGVPKYSCTITPAAPPKPQEFQVTQYALKLTSGSPPANKQIKVVLGIQPNGPALTSACTRDLKNGSLTVGAVIVAPPVSDPNYIWTCNASQTSTECEAPSTAVPR